MLGSIWRIKLCNNISVWRVDQLRNIVFFVGGGATCEMCLKLFGRWRLFTKFSVVPKNRLLLAIKGGFSLPQRDAKVQKMFQKEDSKRREVCLSVTRKVYIFLMLYYDLGKINCNRENPEDFSTANCRWNQLHWRCVMWLLCLIMHIRTQNKSPILSKWKVLCRFVICVVIVNL